jgi:PAS domain S-box-containing protein
MLHSIDRSGRLVFVSDRWLSVLGYGREEVIGRDATDFLTPASRELSREVVQPEFFRTGLCMDVEYQLVRKDGTPIDVLVSAFGERDDGGEIVRSFSVVVDVSRLKRVEEDLRTQRDLSESLLAVAQAIALHPNVEDTLHNALRIALERTGADSGSLFLVDESQAVTHYSQDGSRVLPPLDGAVVRAVMEKGFAGLVLRTREAMLITDTSKDERWLPLPDRFDRPNSAIGVPLWSGGRAMGVFTVQRGLAGHFTTAHLRFMEGAASQISLALRNALILEKEQRLVVELRQAKEAAEAASRSKSSFLAHVSHELRTPLNAILGYTQLMSQDPAMEDVQRERVRVIGRSGEHLLGLINDVLEMSKIEAGHTQLHPTHFDPASLVEDVASMFRRRAAEKGLALTFQQTGPLPRDVRADEGKLRQVLVNLIGNAIKFTSKGGVTVRCRASASEREHPGLGGSDGDGSAFLVFEVEDTGPGIAPADLDRVFEPFTQAMPGRGPAEGTGLGLAISRRFVRLMEGELRVVSELTRGTTFSFDVRVALADSGAGKESWTPVPTKRPEPREADTTLFRVLVAEDNPENRQFLVGLLGSRDSGLPPLELREAANGREAVELVEAWSPHLVCLDMRMPVMNGYEALRRIRGLPAGRDVKVIALTASAFEEDKQEVLAAGCDDFVRKPIRIAELVATLAKHLGAEAPRQAAAPRAERRMSAVLTAMPDLWRARLRRAATIGDVRQLTALIEELRRSSLAQAADAGDALGVLVHNFRYEEILALVEDGPAA